MPTTDQQSTHPVRADILSAFDAMWGGYPAPVMLIRANREIVATNAAGQELGIPTGTKCFQLTGREKICEGCLGNEALKEGVAKRVASWQEKLTMFADTYWIPVQGEEGLYIHFGNNITPYVKDELCG